MPLEERIRAAIKGGNLLSVSLYKSVQNPKLWIATYLNADNNKRQLVEDEDPIVALEKAIRPLRSKPDEPPVKLAVSRQVKPKRRQREDDLI